MCRLGITQSQRVGSGGGNVVAGLLISPMVVLVEMVVVVRGGIMAMDRRTAGSGACKSFAVLCCLFCLHIPFSVYIFPFLLR